MFQVGMNTLHHPIDFLFSVSLLHMIVERCTSCISLCRRAVDHEEYLYVRLGIVFLYDGLEDGTCVLLLLLLSAANWTNFPEH